MFKNIVQNLDISKGKPRLLLHVCCGPCSTIPLERLKDYFDITLLFNNSNIYPKKEHDRRYEELNRYIDRIVNTIFVRHSRYGMKKHLL